MRPDSSKKVFQFTAKKHASGLTARALLFAGLVSFCCFFDAAAAADDTNQKGAAQLAKDLHSASSIILLSIESPSAATRKKKEFSVFHGYEILGKTQIAKGETGKIGQLVSKQIGAGYRTQCLFQPHHALVISHDKKNSELVICFTCGDVEYFKDGQDMGMLTVNGGRNVISELEKTLNGVLAKNKIPQSDFYLKSLKRKVGAK